MATTTPDIRAMLFDFDGTLAELTLDFDLMRERARAVAAEFFPAVPEHNGRPVLEWAGTLAASLQDGEANELLRRFADVVKEMEMESARNGRLFHTTRPVLAELARRGVAVGIVTRNCSDALFTVFPDALEACGCVLTRDDVDRVKPHPEHLLAALRTLGVAPQHALMAGDHPMDVQAGKRAGTLTAGVAAGYTSLDELRAAGPDYAVHGCDELLRQVWG